MRSYSGQVSRFPPSFVACYDDRSREAFFNIREPNLDVSTVFIQYGHGAPAGTDLPKLHVVEFQATACKSFPVFLLDLAVTVLPRLGFAVVGILLSESTC